MVNLSKYKNGQWFPGYKKRFDQAQKPEFKDTKRSGQSKPSDSMTAKLAIYGHSE